MATTTEVTKAPSALAARLELYAKRLERERRRLRAELREVQLRIAWRRHERAARGELDPELVRLLDAAGILAPTRAELDDRRTAHRRRCQLAAVDALEAFTEAAISAANTRAVLGESSE